MNRKLNDTPLNTIDPHQKGHDLHDFLATLKQALAQSLQGDRWKNQLPDGHSPETIMTMVEAMIAGPLHEKLQDYSIGALSQIVLSLFQFMQQRQENDVKLLVFNPAEQPGEWQTGDTVIQVLMPDMPFIVDSLRVVLNQLGHTIHYLYNAVANVSRSASGALMDLQSRTESEENNESRKSKEGSIKDSKDNQKSGAEALIYLQINPVTTREAMQALESTLQSVLNELTYIVNDFPSILALNKSLQDRLSSRIEPNEPKKVNAEMRRKWLETIYFLQWLADDHFIFLGSQSYRFERDSTSEPTVNRGCFAAIEGSELGIVRANTEIDMLGSLNCELSIASDTLLFAKSSVKSRHHRAVYPDMVMVREFDEQGLLVGEVRYVGLYTSRVYNTSCLTIPFICRKVRQIAQMSQFPTNGHDAKALMQVLESFPREELFQTPTYELFKTVMGIVMHQERQDLLFFLRHDPFERFISALVFISRDSFNTQVRLRVQNILQAAFQARELDFSTLVSESTLARVHFTLLLDPDQGVPAYDLAAIHEQLVVAARTWEESLQRLAVERLGKSQAMKSVQRFLHAFPAAYQEAYRTQEALDDIHYLNKLKGGEQSLEIGFFPQGVGGRHQERVTDGGVSKGAEEDGEFRIKLYYRTQLQTLSDVLPILENLGFVVLNARPYQLDLVGESAFHIDDFRVRYCQACELKVGAFKEKLRAAFKAVWCGDLDNDPMNRLVMAAQLHWREVALLRAYANYLKQIKFGFSQTYIQEVLFKNASITRQLMALFDQLFNPVNPDLAESQPTAQIDLIKNEINQISSLDEDRTLTRYLQLILATLRTNFYIDAQPNHITLKLNPSKIPDLPKPVLAYEIFLYSPIVEGVHLRGGLVARGGLRWSERGEDYRTEILGLVKAQQVKNSVIVPVGAKGGFVIKKTPPDLSREAAFEYGREGYKTFIRGLLEVTDNMEHGKVKPPSRVVRRDGDDPYLVIAADKGTATFSDTANAVAKSFQFWMGDGFASGGSAGYDHKKMGITARGAWVSVQRLFREMRVNVQTESITVVGIGDMGGDVFGNGLLQSKAVQLVAAFNHLHIFIDPNPDPERSYAERKRCFEMPRTSWEAYDLECLSAGGGLFSRSAKQIAISPEMQQRFDIEADQLTPDQLIRALLKAPVDLIWNGGIGTYVKASSETDRDVGDKANDALRVNGCDVRAKVIGEGGNLGLTQLGRVEYSSAGGRCNTDFIDNAGGVACSDQEVNIKIALNQLVAEGELSLSDRDQFLEAMTDQVADIVLQSNYRQVQAISLAERQISKRMEEYRRFIHWLEQQGRLDRELESIPSDEQLLTRKNSGLGLVRPEIAVVMAYAKSLLKEQLIDPAFIEDPIVAEQVVETLPRPMSQRYRSALQSHQLLTEMVATHVANQMINQMGITFVKRMEDATGANASDVAKVWLAVQRIFGIDQVWRAIESLDFAVDTSTQMEMMLELVRLSRGACRWVLRNFRSDHDIGGLIDRFKPGVDEINGCLPTLLSESQHELMRQEADRYQAAGVPEALAQSVVNLKYLKVILSMIQAAQTADSTLPKVLQLYFALSDTLQINWISDEVDKLSVDNHWEAIAREALRDDLEWQLRSLTVGVLQVEKQQEDRRAFQRIDAWLERHHHLVERWNALIEEIKATKGRDFPIFSVVLRELMDLAQSTTHCH